MRHSTGIVVVEKKPNAEKPMYLNFLRKSLPFFLVTMLLLLACDNYAQKLTNVHGKVVDAKTKEPLPFVNITFVGTNVGTTTDLDGKFHLESKWASNRLQASFVGYTRAVKDVKLGKKQTIKFQLESSVKEMRTFVITGIKRYRNKDNPAVTLIKNVVKNKEKNRKGSTDYLEYDKYEMIELDLNNITEEYLNKPAFKHFKFMKNYIDTSDINGKPFLPIFLRETTSSVYHRKKPKAKKEYVNGSKITGFEKYLDEDGISFLMDKLYQDVDIYDNKIYLLSKEFVSPISNIAPTFYKFFILDTVEVLNRKCVKLAFMARNKAEYAFKGNLFIACDSTYAVVKVKMGVDERININFITDIRIDQEFSLVEDTILMLSKDEMVVDYSLTRKGVGMFGKKAITYSNYLFDNERGDSIYSPLAAKIRLEGSKVKSEEYWEKEREKVFADGRTNTYVMIDSLQNLPAFKRTMDILMIIISGYVPAKMVEIGPVNTFFSVNDIEGRRLRFGGRTTPMFNEKFMLEGYVAYGLKDKAIKYFGGLIYSFNDHYLSNPKHQLVVRYKHETNFPGQSLQFLNEDNILLSFRRGTTKKMILLDSYYLEYWKEFGNGFSYRMHIENTKYSPLGELTFRYGNDRSAQLWRSLMTTTFGLNLRLAVNEQYYQGKKFRVPMVNKYPIFNLDVQQGVANLLGGQFNFTRVDFTAFKRLYMSPFGFSDVEVKVGKLFGTVPYPLLNIPQANQSYAYQIKSFNLMSFLEFVNDEYVSFNYQHALNGFIFNRIPLFSRLKLREMITLKAIYGRVTDTNNPDKNSDAMSYPYNDEGNRTTFALGNLPYLEASIGVANIFKLLRLDLVKRLNYLDSPDVDVLFGIKGIGIRGRLKVEF